MKRFLKTLSVMAIIIILASGVLWVTYPRQSLPKETITSTEGMEAYFNQITEEGFPPSMNVSVIKDGVLVYDQGL